MTADEFREKWGPVIFRDLAALLETARSEEREACCAAVQQALAAVADDDSRLMMRVVLEALGEPASEPQPRPPARRVPFQPFTPKIEIAEGSGVEDQISRDRE
jgi:hypothetical protein